MFPDGLMFFVGSLSWGSMAIFQCPVCELRFALNNELEQHISEAHPDFNVDHEKQEDEMLSSIKRRRREEGRAEPT